MTPRQHTLHVLKFVRETSNAFFSGIPDDKWTWQASPTDNHPLWVMGHLAGTDAWFAGVMSIPGITFPNEWQPLFGMGSKPAADRSIYPSVAQVRERYDTNRQLLIEWFEGASEQTLANSLSEKTQGFALDPVDFLLKGAWHEGWHMGQVATARKALGLPNVMG
jgi:hypothetical protein